MARTAVVSGRVRISPLCAALVYVAVATPARAYEDHVTVGAGAGYAYSAAEGWPHHGAMFDLSASVGMGPVWSVRAHASYALHPGERSQHAMLLGGDLLYLVDVLEVVPYFGVGAGGIARARRDDLELDAAAHLVLGVDYLISRELTLEFEARPYLLVTELSGQPFYGTVGAAVVFMFDG